MTDEKKPGVKDKLKHLWDRSTELTGEDPASKYLRNQGLTFTTQNIRYCADCLETESEQRRPAMVARVQPATGAGGTLHLTYITKAGLLADIKYRRRLIGGMKPAAGCAVQLFPQKSKMFPSKNPIFLGVAEGIENALSVAILYHMPCWAVPAGALLETFQPPAWAREVIIFGNNDANFVGHVASYTLASRLFDEGRLVSLEFPETAGKDFNDVLREKYDLPNL